MPLSKRHFFATLLVALLCLVAANYVVAFLVRNSIPRQLIARIAESPGASVVAFGNSLTLIGFDTHEFDASLNLIEPSQKSINLAMSSTGPVEHLLYLRFALAHRVHPRLILYGFLDLQLSSPVRFTNAEILGNRDVLYYLDPEYGRRFYSLSARDAFEFEVMRHSAMLRDRSAVWAKIERFRRRLADQGMPPVANTRFGRAADFSLLEPTSAAAFASEVDAATQSPLAPPIQEMLRLADQAGATLVFIEMPMSAGHRHLFYDTPSWRLYRASLQSKLAEQGALYVDASNWISDDSLFMDRIHLSPKGGAGFTRRVADLLRQKFPLDTPRSSPSRNSPSPAESQP